MLTLHKIVQDHSRFHKVKLKATLNSHALVSCIYQGLISKTNRNDHIWKRKPNLYFPFITFLESFGGKDYSLRPILILKTKIYLDVVKIWFS